KYGSRDSPGNLVLLLLFGVLLHLLNIYLAKFYVSRRLCITAPSAKGAAEERCDRPPRVVYLRDIVIETSGSIDKAGNEDSASCPVNDSIFDEWGTKRKGNI